MNKGHSFPSCLNIGQACCMYITDMKNWKGGKRKKMF